MNMCPLSDLCEIRSIEFLPNSFVIYLYQTNVRPVVTIYVCTWPYTFQNTVTCIFYIAVFYAIREYDILKFQLCFINLGALFLSIYKLICMLILHEFSVNLEETVTAAWVTVPVWFLYWSTSQMACCILQDLWISDQSKTF